MDDIFDCLELERYKRQCKIRLICSIMSVCQCTRDKGYFPRRGVLHGRFGQHTYTGYF